MGTTPQVRVSSNTLYSLPNAKPCTETAVPYTAFKKAGFEVQFATENGKAPQCDQKMLIGITQKLLVGPSFASSLY